jgi:hypothetical protein
MLVTSLITLGFDGFTRARPVNSGNVLLLSIEMLLNGLFLDVLEHFNFRITNLEPQSYFGPTWITLFFYRLFYGFNSLAIVALMHRLHQVNDIATTDGAGTQE